MRTLPQIEAARKNGAESLGPVTPEGKAISSANALKHGLLAEAIVISGEGADHLAALSARFHAEFHPRTQTETHHVETMIMCRWRLHRVWEFESASLNHEIEKIAAAVDGHGHRTRAALAFKNLSDHSRSLDLLSRYETKFARAFLRAHQALMELKATPVSDWSEHDEHSVLITDAAPASSPGKSEILPNEPEPDPTPVL
jgi:hypothetical protein